MIVILIEHMSMITKNSTSRRVLEKVGFVKEGYSEKYLQIQGES